MKPNDKTLPTGINQSEIDIQAFIDNADAIANDVYYELANTDDGFDWRTLGFDGYGQPYYYHKWNFRYFGIPFHIEITTDEEYTKCDSVRVDFLEDGDKLDDFYKSNDYDAVAEALRQALAKVFQTYIDENDIC